SSNTVKVRYIRSMIQQEPEGSTQEHSTSEYKGIVSTDMELVLEQTKQGTSHEVSVSTEGVEE
ncbi:hypothetical protein Tco_1086098, partial [Tanacetum coccineum]